MTDPLRLSFDVACSAGHAFSVWTSGIGTWWPPDHTVTGQPALVVLTSGVGGRIYHLQEQGMQAVQAYLERVWGDAARRFRLLAENTGNTENTGNAGDKPRHD